MKLDDALSEAFDREASAVPERRPNAAEVSRALRGNGPRTGRGRGIGPGYSLPVLAMAAAAVVALCLNPASARLVRPLATDLAASLPDETGSRFLDFVLVAGESYRSLD